VGAYREKRKKEPSGRTPKFLTKPASINREIALLKTIYSKALKNGKAEVNPTITIKMYFEDNERTRILTQEEYIRLLAHSSPHIQPIIKIGYQTGMRIGEILPLNWGQIDLKNGFIELESTDTKTKRGRDVPLSPELIEMFRGMVQGLPNIPVFTYKGKPIKSISTAFTKACKRAGIEDFVFHDLRHTFITNKCDEGHHNFRIMAATGHKTMSCFKRYYTSRREDLQLLVNGKHTTESNQK
jgi:integrase